MSNFPNPSSKRVPAESKEMNGGEQHIFKFPNGWQASVIRGRHTYGGIDGLFEIAVLDRDGHLNYDTSVTSDVIGHLDREELDETLDQIAALDEAP